jgi:hypothetical protein
MRPRKELPEPLETFVKHHLSITKFLGTYDIPPETFRRWASDLRTGKRLSRGANALIEKIQSDIQRSESE